MPVPSKTIPALSLSDIIRFQAKVHTKSQDQCWPWLAASLKGYGIFSMKPYGNYIATRIVWYLHYKADPGEELVLHVCNNPSCCNPDHLYLGSYSDNNQQTMNDGHKDHIRGSLVAASQLAEHQIPEIRELRRKGWSIQRIRKRYGVAYGTIQAILSGRTWTHV